MATNVGTQLKFNLSLTLPGGLTMDDVDFSVEFFIYSNRILKREKKDAVRVDANNYLLLCDTDVTGKGEVKARVKVILPDGDFGDRKEIETVSTKVIVS